MEKLQRYLVRRPTKEVFIWTQALADNHKDLEEVMAADAQSAIGTKAMPDPRHISLVELESMTKKDLIIWAKLKLNVELDAAEKHGELVQQAKLAIFSIPPANDSGPDEVSVDMRGAAPGQAVTQTTPMATSKVAKSRKGA